MLRIAICDDNFPITTEIENLLLNISKDDCIPMDIRVFFDGETLYQEITSGNNFDIIYMDIEMNTINGIEAARLIRSHNLPTILIYISAFDTYFQELFEVEPFRFIPKPIDENTFYRYFTEAYKKLNNSFKFFTFGFHQKYTKVPIADILYFESCGRDIIIHTTTLEHRFLDKLDAIETYMLDQDIGFLRIHQSYLVNPYHIHTLTLSYVELENGCRLRVSPRYQSKVRTQYSKIIEGF